MKKKVTLSLDEDRYDDLRRIADGRGVSVSMLVDELAGIAREVAAEAVDGSR